MQVSHTCLAPFLPDLMRLAPKPHQAHYSLVLEEIYFLHSPSA